MASSKDQSAEERYGLFCPSGGSFYTCIHTQIRFLGCCETDPCSNGGECPVDRLRPASYANYSGPHQNCVAPYDEGEWYTCDDATPKFMGCCTQDPCNNGCPNANLIPARLDDDDGLAAPFLSQPTSSTSTSTTTSSAPSRTETVADTGTPSSEPVKEPSHTASSRSIGLIVGLSMMGVVILLIIIGIILWWKRRKNVWESNNQEDRRSSSSRNENENQNKTTSQNVLQTGPSADAQLSRSSFGRSEERGAPCMETNTAPPVSESLIPTGADVNRRMLTPIYESRFGGLTASGPLRVVNV